MDAGDRPFGHDLLYRRPVSAVEEQSLHRRTGVAGAGAARARWRKGHEGGASAQGHGPAHPRCPHRTRWRALAAHRQPEWSAAAADARALGHHLWNTKKAPKAISPKPTAWFQ